MQSAGQPSGKKAVGASQVQNIPAVAEINIIEGKIPYILFIEGIVPDKPAGFHMRLYIAKDSGGSGL